MIMVYHESGVEPEVTLFALLKLDAVPLYPFSTNHKMI